MELRESKVNDIFEDDGRTFIVTEKRESAEGQLVVITKEKATSTNS
ncbi:hypothetical protein [Halalkalibacterium ligniniphilum]|nr:hypothetical protein [Halalkalibacterium ligniniphilum]